MSVRAGNVQGVHVVTVAGPLIGGEDIDALRSEMKNAIHANEKKLLIDLSDVPYVNSTAIGVLMSAYTSYTRRNWALAFCGLNKEVNAVFAITRLTHIFEILKTRAEAIKRLSQAS